MKSNKKAAKAPPNHLAREKLPPEGLPRAQWDAQFFAQGVPELQRHTECTTAGTATGAH